MMSVVTKVELSQSSPIKQQIIVWQKERATCLCTNWWTVDSHCAVRPFRGMPPLVSSTGHTASRSCQATTNSWLVSIFQTAVVLNRRFVQKQRKANACRVKNTEKGKNRLLDHPAFSIQFPLDRIPLSCLCCGLRGTSWHCLLLRPSGTRRHSLTTTVDVHTLTSLHGKRRVV